MQWERNRWKPGVLSSDECFSQKKDDWFNWIWWCFVVVTSLAGYVRNDPALTTGQNEEQFSSSVSLIIQKDVFSNCSSHRECI